MHRYAAVASALGAIILASVVAGAGVSAATPDAAHTSKGVTISLRSTSHGKVLVGKGGKSLYEFAKDQKNVSHCTANCQATWAPLASGAHAGAGVEAGHLGRTSKGQATYYGHPLYYYAGDTRAGQTNGEDLNQYGAKWYLLSAKGAAVR